MENEIAYYSLLGRRVNLEKNSNETIVNDPSFMSEIYGQYGAGAVVITPGTAVAGFNRRRVQVHVNESGNVFDVVRG